MSYLNFVLATSRPVAFANDFDTDGRAYIPEVWAQESLMVLEENMVAGNLVHRDFEDEIAEYGDVVNTRRPGSFTAKRKIDSDSVTIQDATAEKVQVKLNQHLHTTFMIKDGEMTKSFKDLITEFLKPAVVSLASAVDQIVLNQGYQFMANSVGKLGTAAGKSTVIAANTMMNTNKVPVGSGMRNFILTPGAEGDLLDVSDFTKVNESGDGGEALQNAMLGRKFGFDFYMAQNTPSVPATQTTQAASVNLTAGYAAGTTTMVINDTSDTLLAGQWFTVAGDMVPQMITAATGTPTTSITFAPGLKTSVANDAVITVYPYGQVDLTAGYAAGWVKDITTKTFAQAPLNGQMLTYGITAARDVYGLIGTPTITNISLDRETQSLMADSAQLNLGPAGDYSLAFHRNAIALVSRPLVAVPSQFGANQATVSYNGLSMRVSMQYDGNKQGMLVTAYTLVGIKVLDPDLGGLDVQLIHQGEGCSHPSPILLGEPMFRNALRQNKVILYKLKRGYGMNVLFRIPTTNEYDITTGAVTREYTEVNVRRAVVLPNRLTRDFVYDLAYIASNKNFTEGGYFDKSQRNIIVQNNDLKGNIPNLEWECTFQNKEYVVKEINETEDNEGYILTCIALERQ